MSDEKNQHFNTEGFDDEEDFRDGYDEDSELDDFDNDSLPYVSSYSEKEPSGLWLPMLAAALLAVSLALGFTWYSLHQDIATLEQRLAKIPQMPPGVVDHEHPPSPEFERLEVQLQLFASELQERRELLALAGQPTETAEDLAGGQEPSALKEEPSALRVEPSAPKEEPSAPRVEPSPAPVEPPRAAGKWVINLGSFKNEDSARAWANKLTADGYPVEVAPSTRSGATLYRVRVTGLPNKTEASRIVALMQANHQLKGMWVSAP